MIDSIDPSLQSILVRCPCLVGHCRNRQDHWTTGHPCQNCGFPGHSRLECGQPEELRLLRIMIRLQGKYLRQHYLEGGESESDESKSE